MKQRVLRRQLPLFTLVLALLTLALLVLACEEEGEEVTPTPPAAETPAGEATPTEEATPAALRPGAAGIPSNPREVRGLEGILTLDDGLAMFKERPASENRTGVTADTIKLGRPTGMSGLLALYDVYWTGFIEAAIERVNEAGGIHGRKIVLLNRDDKSDPAVGVQVTRELIEGDKIFAMFFQFGSPTHAAMHDYHVAQGVPNLFYLDGSNTGQEPATSPWDFPGLSSDIMGGMALAENVYQQDPNAKVAIVYADFPASVDGRDGIRFQLEKRGVEVVGEFAHDLMQMDLTSVAQQVGESGATWLIYHGTQIHVVSLVKALRETVGWTGNVAQWGWVPGDPMLEDLFDGTLGVSFNASSYTHPELLPMFAKLETLAEEEGVPYDAGLAASAMVELQVLVRGLELAGPDLTREGLIEALENGFTVQDNWKCALGCIAPIIYGPQDHRAWETWNLTRWNNASKRSEILATLDFETSKGLGLRGNYPGLECQPASAEFPEGTCPWKAGS